MTREKRLAVLQTAKAMGLRASAVPQLLQHGRILEPGRHPADLLQAIRKERTGHVPALRGVDLASLDVVTACNNLNDACAPNATSEARNSVTPLKDGPRRPKKGA